MRKRLLIALAVIIGGGGATLSLYSASQDNANEKIYSAGSKVAARGIGTYYVSPLANGGIRARFQGTTEAGRFEASPITKTGTDTVELEWRGLTIKMVWDKAAKRTEFFKNGSSIGVLEGGKLAPSVEAFLKEQTEALALLRDMINELLENGAFGEANRPKRRESCGPRPQDEGRGLPAHGPNAESVAKREEHGCDYENSYAECELGWTRTGACEDATTQVNQTCTNFMCWGCCSLAVDCDCVCAADDFICDCCRRGGRCTIVQSPKPAPTLQSRPNTGR